MIGVTVFVLAATPLDAVPARSAVSSLHLLLTPQEQAARLWLLATPETAKKLFPSTATESTFYFQRNYRREYRNALQYDRARLAERLGEQGRARFAAERGWTKLLGSGNRGIRQGPDSVYWDRQAGVVRVLEAKGGNAWPAVFYGSPQNTNQYAIRSARRVLKSPIATEQARVAAARVIVAAQKHRLVTGVVRTSHKEGNPDVPRLEGRWNRTNVRSEALAIERALIQESSGARQIFRETRREQSAAMLQYRAAQSVAILGLAGAAGLGWDAYQQSRVAWWMLDDPTLQGSPLPHLQTGIAIGRIGQTTTLGVSSAAQLETFRLPASAGLVRIAGAVLLPVTFGVEGMRLTTAYYEYNLGRISQRDLYRRATGSTIAGAMIAGGTILGGLVGLPAGGVGALPGAAAGAKIAVFIAIPVQLAADYLWGSYYQNFDARQRRLANAAVDRFYGLEPDNQANPH